MKIWNKVLLLCIFLSIAIVYKNERGDLSYAILLTGAIGAIIFFLLKEKPKVVLFLGSKGSVLRKNSYALKYLNICWILMFLSWVYGVFIGFLNSNSIDNIFRNFFGFNLYLLMPLFYTLKPKKIHLYMAIAAGCAVQCLIAVYELIQTGFELKTISSISDARFFYSIGLITALPLFSYYLSRIIFVNNYTPFENKKRSFIFYFLILTLLSFFIIIPPASKGFLLAWFFALLYIIFLYGFKYFSKLRISINGFFVFLSIIIFSIFVFNYFGDVISYSYSLNEESNAVRSEQYFYIVEDLNFIGHGLGAKLSSGYTRDETGYGMELTYLNLVHKLGFFSIFLFLSYLCTYISAFKIAIKSNRLYESCFSFGGMGFCIIGAGNPLLLSPTAVVLHCVIMYIILDEEYVCK